MRALRPAIVLAVATALLAATLAGDAVAVPPAGGAEAWREAARTGEPLTLSYGGARFSVVVAANDVLLGGPVRDLEGRDVDLSDVLVLAGRVVGDERSAVRVTVAGDDVAGLVLTSAGALVVEGDTLSAWVVEPLTKSHDLVPDSPVENEEVEEVLDFVDSVPPFLERTIDGVEVDASDVTDLLEDPEALTEEVEALTTGSCLRPVPPHIADPAGLALGWSPRIFDVAFVVDQEFVNAHGPGGWARHAITIANSVDGIFEREIGLRVRIADLHAHGSDVYRSLQLDGALSESRSHYAAAHAGLARENVHLLSGKSYTDAAGMANCIGGAGDIALAYTAGEAVKSPSSFDFGVGPRVTMFRSIEVLIAAHEMEHILSTHHHYADCGEGVRGGFTFVQSPNQVCTMMFPDVGLGSPSMSPTERLVARGWADARDL